MDLELLQELARTSPGAFSERVNDWCLWSEREGLCWLHGPRISIGRREDCGLVIESQHVSKVHAQLNWTDGRWSATDAGSTNGTFANDRRLATGEAWPVESGDLLRFGPHAIRLLSPKGLLEVLRAEAPSEAAVDAAADEPPLGTLASLLTALPGALLVVDDAGRVVAANAACARLLRATAAHLAGRSLADFSIGGDDGAERTVQVRRCDGSEFPATVSRADFVFEDVRGESFLIRDLNREREGVFELLHDEEALQRSLKMEAIGRLASGVTHDFNNVFSVIQGYAERLMGSGLGEPEQRLVERVLVAGERGASLTRKLLELAGREHASPTLIYLNTFVEEMTEVFSSALGESIEVEWFASPKAGAVRADRSHLEQLLLDLVLNARDAMPGGGELRISTGLALLGPERVERQPRLEPGLYARLTVCDTGSGIPRSDVERVIEPFYTTKTGAKGLGLTTVYGTVKRCGGHFELDSAPGRGTTVRIYLPSVRDPSPSSLEQSPKPDTATHCSETVLVVDDEDAVRELVVDVLSEQGYTVLQAPDGDLALELIRDFGGTVHAMITDVMMPRLSGPELALEVEAARSDVRVLFMSGYFEQDPPRGWPLLRKPFRPTALLEKLRQLLDASEVQAQPTEWVLDRLGRYLQSIRA